MLEKTLMDFGLTKNEAKIYLAALELNQGLASSLAKKTKINRSSAYSIINSLQKKGFMSSYEKRGVRYFQAVDPGIILQWGESKLMTEKEKLAHFSSILPSLYALSKYEEQKYPKVKVFEGIEGVRNIFEDTLKERKEIYTFSYIDKIFTLLGQKYTDNYIEQRKKLGIHVNMISPNSNWFKSYFHKNEDQLRRSKLIPLDKFPLQGEIRIYGAKVSIIAFDQNIPFGLIIENEFITAMFKTIFDYFWNYIK